MKVSVAMCTYNGEKFIRRQLDSIFRQTRLPDEIVICDDRSKDNTVAIVEQYKNRGVDLRVIRNETNLGFIDNFRKCLTMCTGDVIFLSDQDDIWKETKTQELCALMEENPGMLSVVTNFHLIDGDDVRLSKTEKGDSPFFDKRKHRIDWKRGQLYKVNLKTILCSNIGPGCTQLIRREIVEDFLKCTLREPHDYMLNRVAALGDGLYYYDKPLTEYRLHGNQTIGVPEHTVFKLRGNYAAVLEEYINLPREFIYHMFFPNSTKVGPPPTFDDRYVFEEYDPMSMPPHLRRQYEQWRVMTQDRAILYNSPTATWRHFFVQQIRNKFYVFGFSPMERLRLFFWELAIFLRRKK